VISLDGKRFSRLLVLQEAPRVFSGGQSKRMFFCQCDCGVTCIVGYGDLTRGQTKSCGCLHRERAAASNITHGMCSSKEYRTWAGMKQRCTNAREPAYCDYAGLMCVEWLESFEKFYAHIGPAPSDAHTVDRIKNELGYVPGNVRWATVTEQNRNQRRNKYFLFDGERVLLGDLERKFGLPQNILRDRIRRGWTLQRAVETPPMRKHA
jgi:hypothetical protein